MNAGTPHRTASPPLPKPGPDSNPAPGSSAARRASATASTGRRAAGRATAIGVVGGIGSGKSRVARGLAERLGGEAIDSDRLGHALLDEPEVAAAVSARFGSGVLGADGRVDRGRLGARVFSDEEARRELEGMLHPRIRRRLEEAIARARTEPGAGPAVMEVPLLFEAGWGDLCDAVVFVDASEETRRARATRGRGWSVEEFQRREAAQWPAERKRALADVALKNDTDDPEALERELDRVAGELGAGESDEGGCEGGCGPGEA